MFNNDYNLTTTLNYINYQLLTLQNSVWFVENKLKTELFMAH